MGCKNIVHLLVMVTSNASLAEQYGKQATFAFAESNVIGGIFTILAPLLVGLASQTALTWRAALAVALLFMLLLYGRYRKIDLTTDRQTTDRIARLHRQSPAQPGRSGQKG